ncbi:MAG: hypothetical protein ACR2RE_23650, partial [Geminicoccaceae bacterium]
EREGEAGRERGEEGAERGGRKWRRNAGERGRKEWSVSNPMTWDDGITIGLSLLLPVVMSMANHDDRFHP